MPTSRISIGTRGCSTAAMIINRGRRGTESIASVRRISTSSSRRSPYPATAPITTPSTTLVTAEMRPMASETRAPNRTRVSTSRPSSSVPNQCVGEGNPRRWARSITSNPNGATTGASRAAMMSTPRNAAAVAVVVVNRGRSLTLAPRLADRVPAQRGPPRDSRR